MTNSPKEFHEICRDLEIELSNLASLGSVMSMVLEGNISLAPVDGFHMIGETEGVAIRWAGFELAHGIKNLFAGFLESYEAALKAAQPGARSANPSSNAAAEEMAGELNSLPKSL